MYVCPRCHGNDVYFGIREVTKGIGGIYGRRTSKVKVPLCRQCAEQMSPSLVGSIYPQEQSGIEESGSKVILENAGQRLIAVISRIRELRPDLGLKEAKDLVDTTPRVIVSNLDGERARNIASSFESLGAQVRIETSDK